MQDKRPDPDDLLARVQSEQTRAQRGTLKIYFGYAAGVGKTYAMLAAAQRERAAGVDVVMGYVEPHGRPDTEALLAGLEALPVREIPYRGVTLREFDLDAALARKPELILVDELAHTNAEGHRHAKRWQDVSELLAAGIDVWTTLNVQHIESLNDVIAQITGVVVRETLPDAVLEQADELELVDLTPEELMDRFKGGKVYLLRQIDMALQGFFQKGNLVALRELLLRQAAGRLQRDVDVARRELSAMAPWSTTERLLVCVGPSPYNARIIRAAKRLASSLGAEWLAVAVKTGIEGRGSSAAEEQTTRNLRLAERLGAETHTLVGPKIADAVLDFAHGRNVSKLVVGKSGEPRWKRWLWGSIVDRLLKRSGDIDVYMVSGDGSIPAAEPRLERPKERGTSWADYAQAGAIVAACGALGFLAHALHLAEANIVMIFLAGVALASVRLSRGPAIASAVASVLVFDFCFVPPYFTFAVGDTEYLITFAVMLGIGLVISELTSRLRAQLKTSQQQEQRTARLYRMTRQLSELAGSEFLIQTAGRQLEDVFAAEVAMYLREPDGKLTLRFGQGTSIAAHPINAEVARWVATNGKMAGAGSDTLPNATAIFVPLVGSQHTVGAVGVRPKDDLQSFDAEQQRLLETCASLIALSIERDGSVLEAQKAQLQVESEQLRNSLLSSVSHDLRTPLATIAGTAGSLLERPSGDNAEMLQALVDESLRVVRLVDNLLDMARLNSGSIALDRQWHVLEEIVGLALADAKRALQNHSVEVAIPADFPLLRVDGFLFQQLFVNLLENAARYTPVGTRIDIRAWVTEKSAIIEMADAGPGLPSGNESRVFEKFFRGASVAPDGRRGVGLGLAICKAIIDAHGGEITARNRPEGGAIFQMALPRDRSAPQIATDEAEVTGIVTNG
jgi:two-component system, OmpR family, sensor histidine kinase KdpD